MAYAPFLVTVVKALREEIAPAVTDPAAADALHVAIRALAAITATLEAAEAPESEGTLPQLAADLGVERDCLPGAGLYLPRRSPYGDLPGGGAQGGTIARIARKIAEGGCDRAQIARLVAWEADLRRAVIARADALESGSASGATEAASFSLISRDRLQRYLRERLGESELTITEFRVIPGGRSRQTVIFEVRASGAVPAKLVCQRDHPANINAQGSVALQYRLLMELHKAGMRVPRPILFEEDGRWLDAPFLVVEQVAGAPIVDAGRSYFTPPPRDRRLALSVAAQMGRLHAVDLAGLADLPRTVDDPGPSGWRKDIEVIRDRWRTFGSSPSILAEASFDWLEHNVGCIRPRVAIVHSDMLLHNLLSDEGEVSAVLDWEMARIGHPAQDLGYVMPVLRQMVDWDGFLAAYRKAGGDDVEQREIDWFAVRAILLFSSMTQKIGDLVSTGVTEDVRMSETSIAWQGRVLGRLSDILSPILAADLA